ncbi:MAG: ornithine cyclodeaminase family protein [Lachnospiraceae bacterium]|nr:ornithine cyclodeaminase family protein [Lachnospiraceae bacterium]
MLYLTKDHIQKAISMREMIESNKKAFAMLTEGKIDSPLRTVINGELGTFLFMPAYCKGIHAAALKVVNVFPENLKKGLASSPAQVTLIDGDTGYIKAILDGTFVTAMRTGAITGAAFDLLAKEHCTVGALFGTGGQAAMQLDAMLCSRRLEKVYVYSRTRSRLEAFCDEMNQRYKSCGTTIIAAASPDEAVEQADLIVTATTSPVPVFDASKVKEGATISCIGTYEPTKHELDGNIFTKAGKVICDDKDACLSETGDLLIPIKEGLLKESNILGSLGDVVLGNIPKRENDHEIIVFESVGVAALDLFAAGTIYDSAKAKGIGTVLD